MRSNCEIKFLYPYVLKFYFCSISKIVSDADLKFLIENLEEKFNQNEKWENVVDKRNNLVSYTAKCCRPKVTSLVLVPS